jgi:hypothetical protein
VGNLPYLEAQILHSKDPKSKILDFLKQKYSRFDCTQCSIVNSDTDSRVLVEFSSLDCMQKTYGEYSKIVEQFFKLMQEKQEDFHFFDFSKSDTNQNSGKSEDIDIDGNSLYLVIKYRTNAKDVIRTKYRFTYKIVDLVGIKSSYEEVEDGFILFYATEEDFQLTQMDLNNFADIKKWMEKKGVWKDSFGDYLSSTEKWLKKRNG